MCMTPALSAGASSLCSRRGSEQSFSSTYSFSTDYSPISPTPVSGEFPVRALPTKNCNGQNLTKEQSNPRGPMTPPNLGHPAIEYPLYPQAQQYLCALAASSVGEKFGCGEMDNFADLPTEWGSNEYNQGTGSASQLDTFYPIFDPCTNQVTDDIRPEFSTMHTMDQPPPTVLPSQTLKYPNPPASGLATPFLSPVKTEAASPSHIDQSDGLSFDYSPKRDDILIDDSLSVHENGLIDSFKRTIPRKRQRQEEDSGDEDVPRKRVPKIPYIVKSWMEKPYPCFFCKKGFDRHEHLTRHNKSASHRKTTLKEHGVVSPEPRKYPCPFCGKPFDRPDNVKPHMKTHMHDGGGNFKNASVSLDESVRKGHGKIDPRSDDYEEEQSKKARTKKRGG